MRHCSLRGSSAVSQPPWPNFPPNNKCVNLPWRIPVDRQRTGCQAEVCLLALGLTETSQTCWEVGPLPLTLQMRKPSPALPRREWLGSLLNRNFPISLMGRADISSSYAQSWLNTASTDPSNQIAAHLEIWRGPRHTASHARLA